MLTSTVSTLKIVQNVFCMQTDNWGEQTLEELIYNNNA